MDPLHAFEEHRTYLFGIAYRMLGAVSDAQDVLQEAWLRWSEAIERGEQVSSPRGYLVRVVTRLAIDRLREEKARREVYVGPWLPEPLLISEPEDDVELSESLRLAFLVILERLSPIERAVFLLREVFNYEYEEIARIVDKSEANSRQILARARKHVSQERPRYELQREEEDRIADQFFAALRQGDAASLEKILAAEVTVWGDGGGKAFAARRPIHGAPAVLRFLQGLVRTAPPGFEFQRARINSLPGVLIRLAGRVVSTMILDVSNGQVSAIRSIVNPDKLAHL